MNNQSVLVMKNINKSFPGVKALNEVNFDLRAGEIHALVGENGAGKSTMVSTMMGLLQPDSGEIFMNGQKVSIDSPLTALSLGIGIVPQELNLAPNLSVAENIFLGMEQLKTGFPRIDWKTTEKKAEEFLAKIGVRLDVKEEVGTLRSAYQQFVQIARALAFGANILILDEPTAALTFQEAQKLFKILFQLKEEGKSIIFISHHMEEIEQNSSRVSVMRDGNLITTIDMKSTNTDEIINLMVGREFKVQRKIRKNQLNKKSVLQVNNLGRHGEFQDISFTLHEGEILGIAGLVGSGRTELVRAIFGETIADQGEIYWYESKVKIKSPKKAINLGMGYVPEERKKSGIFPITSIRENISMPLLPSMTRFTRINRKREEDLALKYIKELKVKTSSPEKHIRLLSGGNQQKVILARWLAKDIKVLILDEPTRGIDINAKAEIHDLIHRLADEGLAVIMISSELEEVINLSDRIMVMHQGEAKGFYNAETTTQEELLKGALS
ncbi:sugar ABC transporter ATP-binding protein [Domibacillus indicus]|uniref:sugar ABC transporter ATP-binding protein n=1 Tax=Domibacillus indicus TaxID=1437523 RepID=UPI0020422CB0|nr:sugar ABC transporter ATP-binding protein [Domibacillus indicus]MCM3788026.1 sugar ABC transporter ATP-binding protein [Domibacillus indicus]